LTYYYADLPTLAQDQKFNNLTAGGPTAGLVFQANSKSGHWTMTGAAQFSRLNSKTDSVRIFPPPYS